MARRGPGRPAMDRGGLYVAFCLFLWSLMLLGAGIGIGLAAG